MGQLLLRRVWELFNGGLIFNSFWTLNNMMAMWGMIAAAYWSPPPAADTEEESGTEELKYGI
ncbi:cellulose synthase [Photobacterium aphoticum]|uniref:Cellulose synthase n=1 Tax=Photobacterium aphoticum TaxID=754436 RepID=A0A090QTZ5_9GAMM|nr:cellulose synthase [Photobacterium aphoticum]